MSDFANIYIIGMNPGYSIERLKSMSDSGPNWIYAMPSDTETLSKVAGLTRSTKILLGSNNEVLGRYRMGQWNLGEWVAIFRDMLPNLQQVILESSTSSYSARKFVSVK